MEISRKRRWCKRCTCMTVCDQANNIKRTVPIGPGRRLTMRELVFKNINSWQTNPTQNQWRMLFCFFTHEIFRELLYFKRLYEKGIRRQYFSVQWILLFVLVVIEWRVVVCYTGARFHRRWWSHYTATPKLGEVCHTKISAGPSYYFPQVGESKQKFITW